MSADPIRHVVLLMLENHSFDQMLGALRGEIDGLDGVDFAHPGVNVDAQGRRFAQAPTHATSVDPDPLHETTNVLSQLDGNNGGFVKDYMKAYSLVSPRDDAKIQQVMGVFEDGSLPALHMLARNFTVCDHWFSSVPGNTWINRFFALTGTSQGKVRMPNGAVSSVLHPTLFNNPQDTIFDRLDTAGVPWRVYHGDIPQSLTLNHQRGPRHAWKYSFLGNFAADAAGAEGDFPQFTFIEPSYYPPGQNDDHPPHSTIAAQRLVSSVYGALRANTPLWESTLLVVTYDEHGGFYDHVSPPAAVSPDGMVNQETGFAFDRLGVRVPAVLVSPWVDRKVDHTVFDHTSLLKYMSDKWGLEPLTERSTRANSLAPLIRTTGAPRTDAPPPVSFPTSMLARADLANTASLGEPFNPQQEALANFAEYLRREHLEEAPRERVAARAAASVTRGMPVVSQAEQAKAVVYEFLEQQKAKAAVVP